MSNGPFTSYAPPGVYTRTITDTSLANLLGELRIPIVIGIGQEYNIARDVEMVRGSSAVADNLVTNEDVTDQFTGANLNFFVSRYPIVTGDGIGKVSYNPKDVIVRIDGEKTEIQQVRGDTGEIILQSIPYQGAVVKIDYYFKRTDTKVVDENLSAQVDGTNKIFKTFNNPIVDGTNGGTTSNNRHDVIVKVNGVIVDVQSVDGMDGLVTLMEAPPINSGVTITYYYNRWQNTYDLTPHQNIEAIRMVGNSPGRLTYIEGTDYIIPETKDRIEWGNAATVSAGVITPQFTAFDNSQTITSLIADKVYLEKAIGNVDGLNKTFLISNLPTEGTGRDKLTDDPQFVQVYVGLNPTAAFLAGGVTVSKVFGATRSFELQTAPTTGNVYVTYYMNRIGDDKFTLKVAQTGGAGIGKYTMSSRDNGLCSKIELNDGLCVVADPDFASDGVTFTTPLKTTPGYSITERVLLTFTSSTRFVVSSNVSGGSGSGSISEGWIGQTYIDQVTGIRFTIESADSGSINTNVNYQAGDNIVIDVEQNGQFIVGSDANYNIPGVLFIVSNLSDTNVNDTCIISTYDKAGNEPQVGDFYYATYEYEKTSYEPRVYTKYEDVEKEYGVLSIQNKISLAAWLLFINGARAIAVKQVLKDPGSDNAPSAAFINALEEIKTPLEGNIKPAVILPITTDETVLEAAKSHCEIQSSMRYRAERICFAGFPIGTDPYRAKEVAEAFASERMIFLYPDGAVVGIIDEYGDEIEYLVDGSFIAAAFAGLNVSPAYDVATPMTRKNIIGFKRLNRRMDEVTMDEVAASGITIIEDLDPNMRVRHARTTRVTDALLCELNIVTIMDYVQQVMRQNLDKFIGMKFLPSILEEIETATASVMKALIGAEIIVDYKNISAIQDDVAPDIARVSVAYKPVFALNYIVVTFNLRSSL